MFSVDLLIYLLSCPFLSFSSSFLHCPHVSLSSNVSAEQWDGSWSPDRLTVFESCPEPEPAHSHVVLVSVCQRWGTHWLICSRLCLLAVSRAYAAYLFTFCSESCVCECDCIHSGFYNPRGPAPAAANWRICVTFVQVYVIMDRRTSLPVETPTVMIVML